MRRILCLFLMLSVLLSLTAVCSFAEDETIFCSNCGKKIFADSKFCSYCGAEVKLINEEQQDSDESDEASENNGDKERYNPFSASEKIKAAIEAAAQEASENADATESADTTEAESFQFNENLLYEYGYKYQEDTFTGQKIFMNYSHPEELTKLRYDTTTIAYTDRIFGKNAAETGVLVANTEGDKSEYHDNQVNIKFFPSIVYQPDHKVLYSFVVSISFPRVGKFGFFEARDLTILTTNATYKFDTLLCAENLWYKNVVFITINEKTIEMFKDIRECGKFSIRAEVFSESNHDYELSASAIDEVLDAWDLYVQAGGTEQNLSLYNKMISIKPR